MSVFTCMQVCAWHPWQPKAGSRSPGTGVNGPLWVTMQAPVTKSVSPAGVGNAFDCWTVALVPFCLWENYSTVRFITFSLIISLWNIQTHFVPTDPQSAVACPRTPLSCHMAWLSSPLSLSLPWNSLLPNGPLLWVVLWASGSGWALSHLLSAFGTVLSLWIGHSLSGDSEQHRSMSPGHIGQFKVLAGN